MSNDKGAVVRLSYAKIRDVSTKDEEANEASTFIVVAPFSEILKLTTDGNLRSYIPGHPGKKRSMVHKAIGDTIRNKPDRFSQLNSGFLVGASKAVVDDQKKILTLWDPSINNGAQSQGEIKMYLQECEDTGVPPNEFSVRMEVSVDPDADVRTEIAIARNTTTKIENLSQAGKRGYFEDLDREFKKVHPKLSLARSETDLGDEFIDTRLLLQIETALMPNDLMPDTRQSIEARMRAYKNAAQCLSEFEKIFLSKNSSPEAQRSYKFFVDMAGIAWETYCHWQKHPAWEGHRLRADANQVTRRKDGHTVADGILFPILAALSNFVVYDKDRSKWRMEVPSVFREERLIEAARRQLAQHQGRPMLMGRSGAAYEGLMLLTEMANEYANPAE